MPVVWTRLPLVERAGFEVVPVGLREYDGGILLAVQYRVSSVPLPLSSRRKGNIDAPELWLRCESA